jgi:hypothetical protein
MESMFPIDSSLLFAILIVMTISAYILILKKLRPKSILTNKIPKQDPKKDDPQTRKKDKSVENRTPETVQSKESRSACSHHFGYLRTLPKNTSLPDECLGCPNIIECLTRERIKKSRGKQK